MVQVIASGLRGGEWELEEVYRVVGDSGTAISVKGCGR